MTTPSLVEPRYLEIAGGIADQLVTDAIWHELACTYLSPTIEPLPAGTVVYRSCRGGLYDGTSGIARFLGHAYATLGRDEYRATALGSLEFAETVEQGAGLYQGRGGIAAVLAELALRLQDDALWDRCRRIASELTGVQYGSDDPWDLVSGAAGTATALACLGQILDDDQLKQTARNVAAGCVAQGKQRAEGLSWRNATDEEEDRDDLCGLAHGASGVALALDVLTATTGDRELLAAASEARRYDLSGYDRVNSAWMDLRSAEGELSGQPFWCHGAGGVAMERMAAARFDPALDVVADAAAAVTGVESWVRSIVAGPHGPGSEFGGNLSVCHGLMGAADTLVEAGRFQGNGDLLRLARQVGDLAHQSYLAAGTWQCGLQGAGPTPGFMLGLAGIGHVFLRLGNPDVPAAGFLLCSKLSWEPARKQVGVRAVSERARSDGPTLSGSHPAASQHGHALRPRRQARL